MADLQRRSRVCLVHYHEIGLKGRNRASFEQRLINNIKALLAGHNIEICKISGRILITILDDEAFDAIEKALVKIPGIVRVSCGWRVHRDMDVMGACALDAIQECEPYETFRVEARRSNTDFPIPSPEICVQIGSYLCENLPSKKVRMKGQDVTVHVEVIQGSAFIYARTIPAVGGLPVGTAGKVVCLMSSGIDSPVAASRLMKRGAIAIGVHFSGRPQTEDTSEYLVKDICTILSKSQGIARLYVIPLGDYQRAIADIVTPSLRIVFYRRFMYYLAEKIALLEGAKAIVTGESLGQVASQTLENIMATNEVVSLPVFRPLIGTDKQEIIAEAHELDTYDISIQEAADCCTLFMPRRPETHADLEVVHREWNMLPIDEWTAEIMDNLEVFDYPCPPYKKSRACKKREESLEF